MALPNNATQEQKNVHYRSVLRAYVDAVNREDVTAILAMYANDGEAEDPVGGNWNFKGIEQVRQFYEAVAKNKVRLRLEGPIVGSKSNVAAMPLTVTVLTLPNVKVNCISVAYFNDQGLIKKYSTHWGPGDYPDDQEDPTTQMTS